MTWHSQYLADDDVALALLGRPQPQACTSRAHCPAGRLCADGRCVCPVLYSGDANCTAHPPILDWQGGGALTTGGRLTMCSHEASTRVICDYGQSP